MVENKEKQDIFSGRHTGRDHLAAYRTTLANERTLLAYIRTALTLFVVGVTFIKFFGHVVIEAIGWIFIPVGVAILLKGTSSFRKMNRMTQREEEKAQE